MADEIYVMKIENWAVEEIDHDPFRAPEARRRRVTGQIFGSPKFKDGRWGGTSPIVELDLEARTVRTQSGSMYHLGEPHPEYVKVFPQAASKATQ